MGFTPPTGGTKRNTAGRATPFRKIILARIRLSNYRTRRITPYSTLCSRIIHPVTQRSRPCNCFHRFLTPRISDSPTTGNIFHHGIVKREMDRWWSNRKIEESLQGRIERNTCLSRDRRKAWKDVKWLVSYIGNKGKAALSNDSTAFVSTLFQRERSEIYREREANARMAKNTRGCKEIHPSFNQSSKRTFWRRALRFFSIRSNRNLCESKGRLDILESSSFRECISVGESFGRRV